MQSAGVLVARKPRLPLRVILGLCATGVSLFILVIPGEMILPAFALEPLYPRMGGCANFLAPLVFLVFLALGVLISVGLIAVGVTAIVLAARQARGGVATAVVVNAVVAMLLLVMPLSAGGSGTVDQSSLGLYVLSAACAVFPLSGTILLLGPSYYRSPRRFAVTLITAVVLLLPGAAGLTLLGLDLGGVVSHAPSATQVSQAAHC
jgi:hypothetical protein